ncbi:MAG: bifunctional DNA-formamidopyrimidine glycosylase/DNA-(apurinic or apyrimidinic site) lyase [Proteobacteria bacterium]|nr:bifunctional DNA-formamidopyrimidine glycosylase/DNA-(apurinic or apyrimidinic site) lyase [Pseudomonadota bacterium]MBI3498998.1 bifunctional DNA-formamidopyrimidine glycosylase/DNA-(apurinic or apyrimidinic site) lyase [Pseudomonadota bacterium]
MPELPEVETVCRGLAAVLLGHVLVKVEVRRPDLRWPLPPDLAQRLTGRRVTSLRRRAKYILMGFDDQSVLIAHLGMSGRMLVTSGLPNRLDPHDHVTFADDSGHVVRFNDARRFGMLDLTDEANLGRHKLLAGLGPEPLDASFDGPSLAKRLQGKAAPIKAALLDQRVVAGLGNIYVSEALFHAGISPLRKAGTVSGARAQKLTEAIKSVLAEAIEAGGSSLRDHRRPDGELGYFQHRFAVYDREGEPCPDCNCRVGVRRIVQSGRSTFYCGKRQR